MRPKTPLFLWTKETLGDDVVFALQSVSFHGQSGPLLIDLKALPWVLLDVNFCQPPVPF